MDSGKQPGTVSLQITHQIHGGWRERILAFRVVIQIRPEPALDLGDGHALALGVVGHLVAVDLAEGEVARLGVGEVEAADARAGPHGERLGDQHAGVRLDVEQAPERALLGVVGAGGIAGGRADAAILFVDELVGAQVLVAAVAPLVAHALVQALGEGFGEAVGEGLGHDGVVVVVLGAEAVAEFLEADAAGDGEGADVVGQAGFLRRDEVGERAAGLAAFPVGLLAQEVEARRAPWSRVSSV